MTGVSDLAQLGALVGDRVRAAMLLQLMENGPTTASDLADAGAASSSLASGHLRKLREGGLVTVESSGRQRVYRLTGIEVAQMLETMQLLLPEPPVSSLRTANTKRRLRRARMCYDHLAGVLGTAVADGLVDRGALRHDSDVLVLGETAQAVLAEIDVDLAAVGSASRPVLRTCTDWTERRPHVAGGLGAAVGAAVLDRRWVVRRPRSRGLEVTADGADGFEAWLGVRIRDADGWLESA